MRFYICILHFIFIFYEILCYFVKTKLMVHNQADTTATVAVPLTLPSFPKFDLNEFTTVGPRWAKYKKPVVN